MMMKLLNIFVKQKENYATHMKKSKMPTYIPVNIAIKEKQLPILHQLINIAVKKILEVAQVKLKK